MNTRSSIARGTRVVLLVAMVVSIAFAANAFLMPSTAPSPPLSLHTAPLGTQIVPTLFHSTRMDDSAVDCIGNGASCEGYLDGSKGTVHVTGNIKPPYYWRLKLTCEFGGDKYGAEKPPSAGIVTSEEYCNSGAPARYWNVLVVR